MPKQVYQLRDFSGGLNTLQDESDIKNNEVADVQNFMFNKFGCLTPTFDISINGRLGTGTYSTSHIDHLEPNYGLGYFETDRIRDGVTVAFEAADGTPSGAGGSERGFYMIGGIDDVVLGARGISGASAGAAVDLTASFPVGADLEFSMGSQLNGGADFGGQGYYKVVGHSGNNLILNRSIQHDMEVLGGTTYLNGWHGTFKGNAYGDAITLLAHPDEHKIDTFSRYTAGTKWEEDSITLNSTATGVNSKVLYYQVDEAIRCCDTVSNNASAIKWYGYIQRQHFSWDASIGTSGNTDNYQGYYAKDNTLAPPTSKILLSASTDTPANYTTYPSSAGLGFNLNIITDTDAPGAIPAGVYECASTFIYDGNQESLPLKYTNTHTIAAANDLQSLSLNVTAKGAYDPRLSGGRIYIREQGTDSEWIMLVDIDLSKGCRTKFSDEYTVWHDASSTTFNCPTATASANFVVKELGLLTYEVINGYSSDIFSNALGDAGENWKDACIANNRAFICNVSIKDEEQGIAKVYANVVSKPDRIMYSMPNRYDTFPSINYIEAAKGDADWYTAIDSFGDRLLAFKRFTLDIINIASPDDSSWFMEESLRYMGVRNPQLVKKTQYGIIFANPNGLFLYNGKSAINLSENKISDSDWSSHLDTESAIIYDGQESLAYVIKRTSDNGDAYMCNLKNQSFTYIKDFVPDANDGITNSVITGDNIYIAHDAGSQSDIYTFDRNTASYPRPYSKKTNSKLTTKMIDFGDPSSMKKVYAVYITYKSDEDITNDFTAVTYDGTTALNNTIAATGSSGQDWATVKIAPASPISCEKLQIKYDSSSQDPVVWINDISIEYRIIKKRTT